MLRGRSSQDKSAQACSREAGEHGHTPQLYAPDYEWGGVHHPQSWVAICAYNAHILEQNRDLPQEEALAEFRATQGHVLELLGRLPERVLTDPKAFFWLGTDDRDPLATHPHRQLRALFRAYQPDQKVDGAGGVETRELANTPS